MINMIALSFEQIYGQDSRLESGKRLIRFIRDLKREIPGISDSTYHYISLLDGPSVDGLPVGFTYSPVLDDKLSELGFLNTGVSLHLGGTNIADVVVETNVSSYVNPNISIKFDGYDKVKGTLLSRLEPTFRFGKVRKTPHNTTLYDLRMDNVSVDMVKEAYEAEIKLIARRLNEIDKRRADAVANIDKTILETLAV